MKDMRHENFNPFLGFFHDCGVFAIVTEYCSRGSLEDLLLNDDAKLDWMFKSSLILDLIKVLLLGMWLVELKFNLKSIEIQESHFDNVFWIYTQIICHKKRL